MYWTLNNANYKQRYDYRFIQIRIENNAPNGCNTTMGVSYEIGDVRAVNGSETNPCVRYQLYSGRRHQPMANHESMELQVCNVTASMATALGFRCEFVCGFANTLALAENGDDFFSADSVKICDFDLDYNAC